MVLLAACGNDDTDNGSQGTAGGSDTGRAGSGGTGHHRRRRTAPSGFAVVQRFPNTPLFTPGEARLPDLAERRSEPGHHRPRHHQGPDPRPRTARVVTDVAATLRNAGIAVPYWEVRANLAAAGTYVLRLEGDDGYGAVVPGVRAGEVAVAAHRRAAAARSTRPPSTTTAASSRTARSRPTRARCTTSRSPTRSKPASRSST